MNIKSILEELGYSLKEENGNWWRSPAVYRQGHNPTSLRINKENGSFIDFPANRSGSFQELLSFSISNDEIKKLLIKGASSIKKEIEKDKLKMTKIIHLDDIGTMTNNYQYFLKRGISIETQKLFGVKTCMSGKMRGRVVFPVYDNNQNLVGVSGRTIFEHLGPKWRHLGLKSRWAYPLWLNEAEIALKREIIIVEGISDILTLWENGIKNAVCLFGVRLSPALKSEIIRLSPQKVVIATNNEIDNDSIGNLAAQEIFKQLSMFFDTNKVVIKLPFKKDFGEMSKEEISSWKTEISV